MSRDHISLLGAVDLLLLDEIHHLADDRGAVLETVVVRMRMLNETYLKQLNKSRNLNISTSNNNTNVVVHTSNQPRIPTTMRIIALSATLPNLTDIGEWLLCHPSCIHFFDDSYRPVPLDIHTIGCGFATNEFLFGKSLEDKVYDVINQYSDFKQTLVFCGSKNSTESLCQKLANRLYSPMSPTSKATIQSQISQLHDIRLRNLVYKRVGYHHAGIAPDDRSVVEALFMSGHILVLCSTTTLAHGCNFPAHLVIVKGTSNWRGGSRGYERLHKSDVIQMLGRAGRPGMDTSGVAVIMTSNQDKEYYEGISLSADVVESTLKLNLIEGRSSACCRCC